MARRRVRTTNTMAKLAFASWETILRRSHLMATGACSPAEYQRMVLEKIAAAQQASLAFMAGRRGTALTRPYLTRAQANAKRLRRF